MVIIYDDSENKYESVKEVPLKTKSSIAKWLVSKNIVKTDLQGEMLMVFLIFIIFLVAGIIFSFGVGNNKVYDLEEGQSEYLE